MESIEWDSKGPRKWEYYLDFPHFMEEVINDIFKGWKGPHLISARWLKCQNFGFRRRIKRYQESKPYIETTILRPLLLE